MKLPSLSFLFTSTFNTLLRFAIPISFAVLGTAITIYLTQGYKISDERETLLARLIMVCSLALPLCTAWKIMIETRSISLLWKLVSLAVAFALLGVFYWTLGSETKIDFERHIYRFAAWNISFHLLVAFAAFTSYNFLNGFWQYNKHLFIRFLTAVIYSGVLYIGLAGAMLAVQELFGVKIDGKRYAQLWLFIAGVFNTVFFFGGLPKNIHDFENEHDYPKGLKLFTQYVLIPLVSLYLIILYAYMAKIAVQMQLPKGWVSNLILAFSVVGIFSLLLVHPVRNLEENKWIKLFSRFYYFSLLPMVALLFIAIGRRINDYGITIERYMVATLGVWLLFISLYFIFSKKKNIIIIPVSLAVIFFFTSFGPWGAFKVSEQNQVKRLLGLYEKVGVLKEGMMMPLPADSAAKVYSKDVEQIYSIIFYLRDYHSLDALRPYFDDTSCINNLYKMERYGRAELNDIEKCTGLKYSYNGYAMATEEITYHFNGYRALSDSGFVTTGFDHLYEFSADKYSSESNSDFKPVFKVVIEPNSLLQLSINGKPAGTINLYEYCKSLQQNQTMDKGELLPADKLFIEQTLDNGTQIKLAVKSISFNEDDNIINITNINGFVFVKKEKE